MNNLVPFSEVQDMSLAVFRGGVFGLKNQEQIMTLMLIAQSENIHPMTALMQYDIIQNKPALKATEALSRYQKSGGVIQWLKTDAMGAKAKFIHPSAGEFEFEYTIEDANLAGLTGKDNWKKRPKEMLRARCVSAGVRMSYPACLGGMHTSDEVEDMPNETPQNPNGIPIAPMTGEVIDAEVERPMALDTMKLMLSNQLKQMSFSSHDIKVFAETYKLGEDEELLEKLVNDKKMLVSLVEEWEVSLNIKEEK